MKNIPKHFRQKTGEHRLIRLDVEVPTRVSKQDLSNSIIAYVRDEKRTEEGLTSLIQGMQSLEEQELHSEWEQALHGFAHLPEAERVLILKSAIVDEIIHRMERERIDAIQKTRDLLSRAKDALEKGRVEEIGDRPVMTQLGDAIEGTVDAILPEVWSKKLSRKHKITGMTIGTVGTVVAGVLFYKGVKWLFERAKDAGKQAGEATKKIGGSLLKQAALYGAMSVAGVLGATWLVDYLNKKFDLGLKEMKDAAMGKAEEMWDKFGVDKAQYYAGLTLYKMGKAEEARKIWGDKADAIIAELQKDEVEEKKDAVLTPEHDVEWITAKEALPLYLDALQDALHPLKEFVDKNKGGLMAIAGTTLFLSNSARSALFAILNGAKMTASGAMDLVKFFGSITAKHPVISTLSMVTLLYGIKEAKDVQVPKDPENFRIFLTNQLEKVGKDMETYDNELIEKIPEEDWDMLSGILQKDPRAIKLLEEKATNLCGQLLSAVVEKIAESPQESVNRENTRGLTNFLNLMESIKTHNPEYTLEDAYTVLEEYVKEIQHSLPLTEEHIQRIGELSKKFGIIISDEDCFYTYDIRDEDGILHSKRLCIHPSLAMGKQVAYAQDFIIDRDDWTEAFDTFKKPGEQVRGVLDYISFTDEVSEEEGMENIRTRLKNGTCFMIMRSGIAWFYMVGHGGKKKYASVPLEMSGHLWKGLSGDFSYVELAMDYNEGIVPVAVFGATSAFVRFDFASFVNGKLLFHTLFYPVTGTFDTGKLIIKSIIIPACKKQYADILKDPRIIVKAGFQHRFSAIKGLVQSFIPNNTMKKISFINRQISLLQKAKKYVAQSRYKLLFRNHYLNLANTALGHAKISGKPSDFKLSRDGGMVFLDREIEKLQKLKKRLFNWKSGSGVAVVSDSVADTARAAGAATDMADAVEDGAGARAATHMDDVLPTGGTAAVAEGGQDALGAAALEMADDVIPEEVDAVLRANANSADDLLRARFGFRSCARYAVRGVQALGAMALVFEGWQLVQIFKQIHDLENQTGVSLAQYAAQQKKTVLLHHGVAAAIDLVSIPAESALYLLSGKLSSVGIVSSSTGVLSIAIFPMIAAAAAASFNAGMREAIAKHDIHQKTKLSDRVAGYDERIHRASKFDQLYELGDIATTHAVGAFTAGVEREEIEQACQEQREQILLSYVVRYVRDLHPEIFQKLLSILMKRHSSYMHPEKMKSTGVEIYGVLDMLNAIEHQEPALKKALIDFMRNQFTHYAKRKIRILSQKDKERLQRFDLDRDWFRTRLDEDDVEALTFDAALILEQWVEAKDQDTVIFDETIRGLSAYKEKLLGEASRVLQASFGPVYKKIEAMNEEEQVMEVRRRHAQMIVDLYYYDKSALRGIVQDRERHSEVSFVANREHYQTLLRLRLDALNEYVVARFHKTRLLIEIPASEENPFLRAGGYEVNEINIAAKRRDPLENPYEPYMKHQRGVGTRFNVSQTFEKVITQRVMDKVSEKSTWVSEARRRFAVLFEDFGDATDSSKLAYPKDDEGDDVPSEHRLAT